MRIYRKNHYIIQRLEEYPAYLNNTINTRNPIEKELLIHKIIQENISINLNNIEFDTELMLFYLSRLHEIYIKLSKN